MVLPRRFALSAICLLAACSDRPSPTTPTPYTPPTPVVHLTGRLVDYHTSQGFAGVVMRWLPNTPGGPQFSSLQSVSDASGGFGVDLPIAARYAFQVEDVSHASGLVIVPGKQLETTLLVNGGPCAARYGTVIDSVTRQPIAGARVTRAGTAETDANGYYRIDIGCVPHGNWGIGTTTISVQHPAYQGASELDGRREATSFSGIRRVDFALQPLAAVTGERLPD